MPSEFRKWKEHVKDSPIDRVKDDAPEEIKKAMKEYEEEFFRMTGRHALLIDY